MLRSVLACLMLTTLLGCGRGLLSQIDGEPVFDANVVLVDGGPSDAGRGDTGSSMDMATLQPDAGSSDAGSSDAGSDAGFDAGSDAGRPDMGMPGHCGGGPLSEPIAGCRPSPVPDTGDIYADCVARINQFRAECQCLPPLQRWNAGESCADTQAEYDANNNTAHGGFSTGVCSPRGNAQNECPRWGSTAQVIGGCLQQMWDEGPGEPFSAHGHYINMSSGRYSRVACGYHMTASGALWAVQNFQ